MGEIKICGTTSVQDLEIAVGAGADAVGIIWHPDRQTGHTVDTPTATRLAATAAILDIRADLLPHLDVADTILAGADTISPDQIQLGETEDPYLVRSLARLQRRPLRQVIHVGERTDPNSLDLYAAYISSFLLDTAGDRPGGTGETHNWKFSSHLVKKGRALGRKVILAGGLTPDNVTEAIMTAQPDGVDVQHGIKAADDGHDVEKVIKFVHIARTAFEQLEAVQ